MSDHEKPTQAVQSNVYVPRAITPSTTVTLGVAASVLAIAFSSGSLWTRVTQNESKVEVNAEAIQELKEIAEATRTLARDSALRLQYLERDKEQQR